MLAIIPGNLSSGFILPLLGPRTTMIIIAGLSSGLWGLTAYSPTLWAMYVCRIALGMLGGLGTIIAQTLVTELSEPAIRGFASGLPETNVSFGILYAYLLLNFLPWDIATYICCVPGVLTMLLGLIVPEVRVYLIIFYFYRSKLLKIKMCTPLKKYKAIDSRIIIQIFYLCCVF